MKTLLKLSRFLISKLPIRSTAFVRATPESDTQNSQANLALQNRQLDALIQSLDLGVPDSRDTSGQMTAFLIKSHLHYLGDDWYAKNPVAWLDSARAVTAHLGDHTIGNLQANLEFAIELSHRIISLERTAYRQGDLDAGLKDVRYNLAVYYRRRKKGDRSDNIEKAIEQYNQVLATTNWIKEDEATLKAMALTSLASAYMDRLKGDREENVNNAIKLLGNLLLSTQQASLQVQNTIDSQAHESTLQNTKHQSKQIPDKCIAEAKLQLGRAYSKLVKGNLEQHREKSIHFLKESLEFFTKSKDSRRYADINSLLGSGYRLRICGDSSENYERAIEYYQEALTIQSRESMPLAWASTLAGLALAYTFRPKSEDSRDLEIALDLCEASLEVAYNLGIPNTCRRIAYCLGAIYSAQKNWTKAVRAYEIALKSHEELYQSSIYRTSRDNELKEESDIYQRAAYATARSGDVESALVILEVGRARSLSETLLRERSEMEDIKRENIDLYHKYLSIVEELRYLESKERSFDQEEDPTELRNSLTTARENFNAVINDIRQAPGHSNFLSPPTISDIFSSSSHRPLVYLVSTPEGTLALVVEHPGNVTPIWIDHFTSESLKKMIGCWQVAYHNRKLSKSSWTSVVDQVTTDLWDNVMVDIVSYVVMKNTISVTLIPVGLFGFLPLHAARDKNSILPRHACDSTCFTYGYNALSLNVAQSIADRVLPASILSVGHPTQVNNSSIPPLLFSNVELHNSIYRFPQQSQEVLQDEYATRENILVSVKKYSILHFCCHGFYDHSRPLASGLVLANEEVLSLQDFLDLRLEGIRLAILSACESAIPSNDLPDEVISLPTGLIQAGVAGVVATLWAVDDLASAILMVRFYDFWHRDMSNPAQALWQAQLWLRDSTNNEKLDFFERPTDNISTVSAEKLFNAIFDLNKPNEYSYAHPSYWAPFIYIGA